MDRAKIASYLGFAIKSRNIIFGEDFIKTARNMKIVLMDAASSDKYKERVQRFAHGVQVFEVENLAELTHRDNVKALAVLDENLANAIESSIKR